MIKRYIKFSSWLLVITMISMVSCEDQDVAAVKTPENNPLVTITPDGDYSSVEEGDTLWFSLTLDKMIENPVEFAPVLSETSTADADDIEVLGGVLPAYSLSGRVGVIVLADAMPEPGETLAFEVNADNDYAWNFQINPDYARQTVTANVKNFDFSLEWSEATYEGEDMCGWGIDLDIYPANADFSDYTLDGASAACPLEHGSFVGLSDDTFDIYVDYYDGGLPDGAGLEIPYVVTISNNSGEPYTITGSFNSDEIGDSHVVGQIVISEGVYTLYDADGNEIGQL